MSCKGILVTPSLEKHGGSHQNDADNQQNYGGHNQVGRVIPMNLALDRSVLLVGFAALSHAHENEQHYTGEANPGRYSHLASLGLSF
jgi:hypothetical protein